MRVLTIRRKGKSLLRVPVVSRRPTIASAVRRMRAAGVPVWSIAARLDVPRRAVERALGLPLTPRPAPAPFRRAVLPSFLQLVERRRAA